MDSEVAALVWTQVARVLGFCARSMGLPGISCYSPLKIRREGAALAGAGLAEYMYPNLDPEHYDSPHCIFTDHFFLLIVVFTHSRQTFKSHIGIVVNTTILN